MVEAVSSLKMQITEDMKSSMRAGDNAKRDALRLILAAIKQQEVDTRKPLEDAQVLGLLDKMLKQRRESISQFRSAGRNDLIAQEQFEMDVIEAYMPTRLSDSEINSLIEDVIASTGASSLKDMGKVMGKLKSQLVGRADMAEVSGKVKTLLTST